MPTQDIGKTTATFLFSLGFFAVGSTPAFAIADCDDLPDHALAKEAIVAAQAQNNGGFGLDMWITIVDRDGEVCTVAFSGDDRGDQWPGSRVISAQKANTANAFSLDGVALSTANLWAATQPGGSLFGLQFSNPVDTAVAYGDQGVAHKGADAGDYGTDKDPMVGQIVGGVNVFGGGLALYNDNHEVVGALGVSGDSSCADHNIAWRARDHLGLDYVPQTFGTPGDNIIFDTGDPFGHPECLVNDPDPADNQAVINACPLGDGPTAGCT